MCLGPLVGRFLPALSKSKASESYQSSTPSWARVMSSKMARKIRTEDSAIELRSEDSDRGGQDQPEQVIRVQKAWVTESSTEPRQHAEQSSRIHNAYYLR